MLLSVLYRRNSVGRYKVLLSVIYAINFMDRYPAPARHANSSWYGDMIVSSILYGSCIGESSSVTTCLPAMPWHANILHLPWQIHLRSYKANVSGLLFILSDRPYGTGVISFIYLGINHRITPRSLVPSILNIIFLDGMVSPPKGHLPSQEASTSSSDCSVIACWLPSHIASTVSHHLRLPSCP